MDSYTYNSNKIYGFNCSGAHNILNNVVWSPMYIIHPNDIYTYIFEFIDGVYIGHYNKQKVSLVPEKYGYDYIILLHNRLLTIKGYAYLSI